MPTAKLPTGNTADASHSPTATTTTTTTTAAAAIADVPILAHDDDDNNDNDDELEVQVLIPAGGAVGLQLEEDPIFGSRVLRFVDGGFLRPGPARLSGKVQPGDWIVSVALLASTTTTDKTLVGSNSDSSSNQNILMVADRNYHEALKILSQSNHPRILTVRSFARHMEMMASTALTISVPTTIPTTTNQHQSKQTHNMISTESSKTTMNALQLPVDGPPFALDDMHRLEKPTSSHSLITLPSTSTTQVQKSNSSKSRKRPRFPPTLKHLHSNADDMQLSWIDLDKVSMTMDGTGVGLLELPTRTRLVPYKDFPTSKPPSVGRCLVLSAGKESPGLIQLDPLLPALNPFVSRSESQTTSGDSTVMSDTANEANKPSELPVQEQQQKCHREGTNSLLQRAQAKHQLSLSRLGVHDHPIKRTLTTSETASCPKGANVSEAEHDKLDGRTSLDGAKEHQLNSSQVEEPELLPAAHSDLRAAQFSSNSTSGESSDIISESTETRDHRSLSPSGSKSNILPRAVSSSAQILSPLPTDNETIEHMNLHPTDVRETVITRELDKAFAEVDSKNTTSDMSPLDKEKDERHPSTSLDQELNLELPTERTILKPPRERIRPNPGIDFSQFSTEQVVVFEPGPVGLQLENLKENDQGYSARIVRFVDGGPQYPGQARKCGKLHPGDYVIRVEAEGIVGTTYYTILHLLQKTWAARRLTFRSAWSTVEFATPPDHKRTKPETRSQTAPATTTTGTGNSLIQKQSLRTPPRSAMAHHRTKETGSSPLPYDWSPLPYDWIHFKPKPSSPPTREELESLRRAYQLEASQLTDEHEHALLERRRRNHVALSNGNDTVWDFENVVLGAVALTAESVAGCFRTRRPSDHDDSDEEEYDEDTKNNNQGSSKESREDHKKQE